MFSSPNLKYFTTTPDQINRIISESKNYGPSYHNVVCDLLEKLKNVNLKEKLPYFVEFARKYTMIPSLWIYWYKTECQLLYTTHIPKSNMHFKSPEVDQLIYSFLKIAYHDRGKHYYADYDSDDSLVRVLNKQSDHITYDRELIFLRQMLHLPHAGMEKLFSVYDKYAADNKDNYPKGKEYATHKYKLVLNLYETLKANERNAKVFIECLKRANDSEFILNSCEYRLGKNPENKEFWMYYLQYLKECENVEMLLKTYSRYCKLFLDDKSLYERWFAELVEAKIEYMPGFFRWNLQKGSIESHVYNTYYTSFFEVIERNEPSVCERSDNAEWLNKKASPASIPSKLTPAIQQLFALPKDTIEHITKTAPPLLLLKLQTTCKYFWHKNDSIYCHRLMLCSVKQPVFFKKSLIIPSENVEKLKKFHVEHSLSVNTSKTEYTLSKLIKQMHSCNLQYLNISTQQLTLAEFEFLTGTRNLVSVYMYNVIIKDGYNNMANFEEIFEFFPNVEIFNFVTSSGFFTSRPHGIKYTSETAYRLAALERNSKLSYFRLEEISNVVDPNDFALFIKKNAAADARLILSWSEKEFKERSKPVVKDVVFGDKEFNEWKLKILFGHGNYFDER